MEHLEAVAAMRSRRAAAAGCRVALVPTMGALHAGHLALVDAARQDADLVVMSLFVNPLQFGPDEDLARYPRRLSRDAELAAAHGVDVLFAPVAEEFYAGDSGVRVVPGPAADRWEGAVRPGHFAGVLTVVAKLWNIVSPEVAWFGQKDIQQFVLLRAMARDLNLPIEVRRHPTVRDPDGLALSSRNAYLSSDERERALAIPRALAEAAASWRDGERAADRLAASVRAALEGPARLAVDYIAVAEPDQLAPVAVAGPGSVIAVGARAGATRLLDNLILGEEDV